MGFWAYELFMSFHIKLFFVVFMKNSWKIQRNDCITEISGLSLGFSLRISKFRIFWEVRRLKVGSQQTHVDTYLKGSPNWTKSTESIFWSTYVHFFDPLTSHVFLNIFFLKRSMLQFWSTSHMTQTSKHLKNFKSSKTWVDQKTSSKWLNFHIKTFLSLKFLKISRKSYEMIA